MSSPSPSPTTSPLATKITTIDEAVIIRVDQKIDGENLKLWNKKTTLKQMEKIMQQIKLIVDESSLDDLSGSSDDDDDDTTTTTRPMVKPFDHDLEEMITIPRRLELYKKLLALEAEFDSL